MRCRRLQSPHATPAIPSPSPIFFSCKLRRRSPQWHHRPSCGVGTTARVTYRWLGETLHGRDIFGTSREEHPPRQVSMIWTWPCIVTRRLSLTRSTRTHNTGASTPRLQSSVTQTSQAGTHNLNLPLFLPLALHTTRVIVLTPSHFISRQRTIQEEKIP